MRTLNNTKSNGRWAVRNMIANGAFANELRTFAAIAETSDALTNHHFVAGFAEEVYRRTCWNGFCDNFKHEGDWHSDGTGQWTVQGNELATWWRAVER
jgi:hypothetical protein